MHSTIRSFAVLAFALSAVAAHADEADGSERTLMFNSTRSAAEVRAEALMPLRISNGSTGVVTLAASSISRQDVRAQAIAAVRSGRISRGETGTM